MTDAFEKVWAVVVTYHPDLSVLTRQLVRLCPQVERVLIVDNGSGAGLQAKIENVHRSVEYVAQVENLGIAAAQNIGIEHARAQGASHVILFDQDSQPAPDMVERLLSCCTRLQQAGHQVASVGPCYEDDRQANPPPFIRVRGLSLTRLFKPEDGDAASVDYLIASGCLIPLAALDEIGDMDSSLFIDYVDIEWGQRARSKGYENFGCFSARMQHSLGDEPICFLGTAYPARSPLRHYYMFRNAVLLCRMRHVPLNWKWADGLRAVLRFGFYALFARPRLQHFAMMSKGLWHGLLGRTGKYEKACRGGK